MLTRLKVFFFKTDVSPNLQAWSFPRRLQMEACSLKKILVKNYQFLSCIRILEDQKDQKRFKNELKFILELVFLQKTSLISFLKVSMWKREAFPSCWNIRLNFSRALGPWCDRNARETSWLWHANLSTMMFFQLYLLCFSIKISVGSFSLDLDC